MIPKMMETFYIIVFAIVCTLKIAFARPKKRQKKITLDPRKLYSFPIKMGICVEFGLNTHSRFPICTGHVNLQSWHKCHRTTWN